MLDLLTQLNRAMAYIEEHIDDDLALADVSTVTNYSPYHFGRAFCYIAELPLSEYIRRRKLSLAAMKLQDGRSKVIDIAMCYGYDSADSFTRAFKAQHGCTPSEARNRGVALSLFLPLTFHIKIKGGQSMNWRIEKREEFEVLGIERIFGNDEMDKVPAFWDECLQNGEGDKLVAAAGEAQPSKGALLVKGICDYRDVGAKHFSYMLGIVKSDSAKTDGYTVATIPKATYAVFKSGKINDYGEAVPGLFERVYSEWLPQSGYDKANTPDLEVYCVDENGDKYEEVWLPVVK